jgi:hypothetical protein
LGWVLEFFAQPALELLDAAAVAEGVLDGLEQFVVGVVVGGGGVLGRYSPLPPLILTLAIPPPVLQAPHRHPILPDTLRHLKTQLRRQQ